MMNQRLLMKIHGYIAVFFLPIAVLYAVTGTAYIVGLAGTAAVTSFQVDLPNGWPATAESAQSVVNDALHERDLPPVSSELLRPVTADTYYWRALTHSTTLSAGGERAAEIRFQKNDFYRQMVEIHKDHAGTAFTMLGFAFGLAMCTLIASGSLMMFRSRLHRRAASPLLVGGILACVAAYAASVF